MLILISVSQEIAMGRKNMFVIPEYIKNGESLNDSRGGLFCSNLLGKSHLLANNSLRTIDWSRKIELVDTYQTLPALSMQVFHARNKEKLMVVDNLLTEDECESIIRNCEKKKLQSMENYYKNGRNNSRLVVFDSKLSDVLWERIRSTLEKQLSKDGSKLYPLGFDVLRGEWKLSGLNQAFRFNKYNSSKKERFSIHRDSQFCPSGDERSIYSVVIYLNDDFKGGETRFYIRHDSSIKTKDLTIAEEVKKFGGLKKGYDTVSVSPKRGMAVIFSQNIIHESLLLCQRKSNESKYILKSDVMLKRDDRMFGFKVSSVEKEDYLKCLNLFREAQRIEIDRNSKRDPGLLYEKCLSIRYSYPTQAMLNKNNVSHETCKATEMTSSQTSSLSSSQGILCEQTGVLFFPVEIWEHILSYIDDELTLKNVYLCFPQLVKLKEKRNADKMIPQVSDVIGVHTKFLFSFPNFVKAYFEECSKVLAVYAVYLLGHSKDDKVYTVNYDPGKHEVVAVGLETLLKDVFYERASYGAIYKVLQQDSKQNPAKDFFHSVDRQFMAVKYELPFFGVDIENDFRCKVGDSVSDDNPDSDDDSDDDWSCSSEEVDLNEDFVNKLDKMIDAIDLISNQLGEVDYDEGEEMTDKLRCLVDGHVTYKRSVERTSSSQYVGAAITRKLKKPVDVSDWKCVCGMGSIGDTVNKSCTTFTFNHLIADFKNQNLVCMKEKENYCGECQKNIKDEPKKSNGDCDDNEDEEKEEEEEEEEGNILLESLIKEIRYEVKNSIPLHAYRVDISAIQDGSSSFNHASCQCNYPSFRLNEYVNLRSYPLLNHVHVVFAEVDGEMRAWTSYGGIVAL